MAPLLLRLPAARRAAAWAAERASRATAATAAWAWPSRSHPRAGATSAAGAATATRTTRTTTGATPAAARTGSGTRTATRSAITAATRAAGSTAGSALAEAAATDWPWRHAARAGPWATRPRSAWPRGIAGSTRTSGRTRASWPRTAGTAGNAGASRRRRASGGRTGRLRRARRRAHAGRGRAERVVARTRPRPGRMPLTWRWRRGRSWSGCRRPRGRRARLAWFASCRLGGRRWPYVGWGHLRPDALILREGHRDSRTRPLRGRRLLRDHRLDGRGATGLCLLGGRLSRRSCPAVSRAPASGGRLWPCASAVGLGGLASEFIFEPADYRRLDCRGRRPNKLTHLLELGHDGLALDTELLREFVNPDLRHCAPSTRPGLLPGLPAGRGRACSVRRQLVLFIAACSSSAHCKSAFFRPVPPAVGTALLHTQLPATRRLGTPRPCRPAMGPAGEGPAEAPCGAGLVPSMPGSDAGMHPGQAAAW